MDAEEHDGGEGRDEGRGALDEGVDQPVAEGAAEAALPVALDAVHGVRLIEDRVAGRVGHGLHEVGQGLSERACRRKNLLPLRDRTVVAEDEREHGRAVRCREQGCVGLGLVGQAGAEVPVEPQRFAGGGQRVKDEAAEHQGAHFMQAELERSRDREVPTAAPQAPEELRVLGLGGAPELTVGRDHVRRQEVVHGETVLPHEPAQPSTQGQADDSRVGNRAPGRGQAEGLGFPVELAPEQSGLRARRSRAGVHLHALHGREVNRPARHRTCRNPRRCARPRGWRPAGRGRGRTAWLPARRPRRCTGQ